jgi:hypothetical protein
MFLKKIWVSKSKRLYAFLFFECLKHMDPFLWNIKGHKKTEMIWWTFDKEKKLLKQKNHLYSTCFS